MLLKYNTFIHLGRLWYSHKWLYCSLSSQEWWNTIPSSYTWAGSGILTGDYIVLYEARNAGAQYIHLPHLGRLRILTGDCIVLGVVRNAWVPYVHLLYLSRGCGILTLVALLSMLSWRLHLWDIFEGTSSEYSRLRKKCISPLNVKINPVNHNKWIFSKEFVQS